MKKLKVKSQQEAWGLKKLLLLKQIKEEQKKGFFLERKKKWGAFPEEAVGNQSYMGGCREVLRVKSGKGEEGVLEQKHSDLKNGEVKRKKRIRRGEKRKQKGVGGNCYWVWVTAPRARRGISVLEEIFTSMVSKPLIFYYSYFLLC